MDKGLDQARGKVRSLRVPWVEVEGPEGPLQINRDGEPTDAAQKWVTE